MEILASLEDDFPSSASLVADPQKYYAAFLQAEEILAKAPKQHRRDGEARLPEMTSFLYHQGATSAPLYRRREDASELLTALWLSDVRQVAGWYIAANKPPQFRGLEPSFLFDLPRKFVDPSRLKCIAPALAEQGIILVWQDALPSMKVDGAAFSFPTGHVVVALSLRYSRLDHFWFTLLHELAHVVKDFDQLQKPIIDDLDAGSDSLIEKRADRLALDSLIPKNEWRSCLARFTNSEKDIIRFAKELGIPPQCVAGRLRRELNRYDLFSKIVSEFNVREILHGN